MFCVEVTRASHLGSFVGRHALRHSQGLRGAIVSKTFLKSSYTFESLSLLRELRVRQELLLMEIESIHA